MPSGNDVEGALHNLGQLLSRMLAPFLFFLSGKKLFPGVSVELTEYCIRYTEGIQYLGPSKVTLPRE